MLFLLDTNAVSDIVREHPGMAARLGALTAADEVATCTIVQGELLFGVERLPLGKRRQALHLKLQSVLAGLRCEPVVEAAGEHYARVKRACQAKGLPLDENIFGLPQRRLRRERLWSHATHTSRASKV